MENRNLIICNFTGLLLGISLFAHLFGMFLVLSFLFILLNKEFFTLLVLDLVFRVKEIQKEFSFGKKKKHKFIINITFK